MTSTVRAEVSTCQTAAAWSRRSPCCVTRPRASSARSRSCACRGARSAPDGAPPARPAAAARPRAGLRDERVFQGELRSGGVPRDARPRVDAAPVQLAAQRGGQRRPLRRLQAHHVPAPPGQGFLGQPEQQLLRRRGSSAGSAAGITRASCLSRSCRVQADCFSATRTSALATARACASRDGGPAAGPAPSPALLARLRPGRARSTPRARCRPAGRRSSHPTAQPARPSRARRVLALARLQRRLLRDIAQLA